MNFKDKFSKGITTINVKTNNFMEENKYKTHISTLESEIKKMTFSLGETVLLNWETNSDALKNVEAICLQIKCKKEEIAELKIKIEELQEEEKRILGEVNSQQSAEDVIYCSRCGTKNLSSYKFCSKCGAPLVK